VPYVDLAGISTYYEQHGAGEPLLLLHGGYCSIETMRPQLEALSTSYDVHAPERPGHGRTPDRPGPFDYQVMVEDSLAYLDAMGVESAHVVGFSDGAIAGLLLAQQHPTRLRSLVAISANLDPAVYGLPADVEVPEIGPPDDDDPEDRAYLRLSPDGPEHRASVLQRLYTMWLTEPHIDPASLAAVSLPTLVLAGDRDSIPTAHTVEIAKAIPGAQLCIVPGGGHLVVRERPAAVNRALLEFLAELD
jgi:pimeloyl-ACP methyl ester carboxylesterase